MKRWFILLLLLFSLPSLAKIYEKVQPDGSVSFTDLPVENSREVDIIQGNTYEAPASSSPSTTESTGSGNDSSTEPNATASVQQGPIGRTAYTSFRISSPTDQQTFHNQHMLKVTLDIQPKLNPGDKVQLMVDSKPVSTLPTNVFVLSNLDRGTHELQANLLDTNGQILKTTSAVTVYIKYTSKLLSPLKDTSPAFNPGTTP